MDNFDLRKYLAEGRLYKYNDELNMDLMEEGEILDEGLLDKIKDKIVAKVDKIKSKFSAEEIAKMKAVAEKAIGKSAEEVTMADFTMDNIKKVGKAISALNEEEQIEEGLGDKLQSLGAGLGLPAMFVGGHMAMASAAGGLETFIAGAIALFIGLLGGSIIKSMKEAQEAPKSNKMDNFDLKKFLTENPLTNKPLLTIESVLNENTTYRTIEGPITSAMESIGYERIPYGKDIPLHYAMAFVKPLEGEEGNVEVYIEPLRSTEIEDLEAQPEDTDYYALQLFMSIPSTSEYEEKSLFGLRKKTNKIESSDSPFGMVNMDLRKYSTEEVVSKIVRLVKQYEPK